MNEIPDNDKKTVYYVKSGCKSIGTVYNVGFTVTTNMNLHENATFDEIKIHRTII